MIPYFLSAVIPLPEEIDNLWSGVGRQGVGRGGEGEAGPEGLRGTTNRRTSRDV